MTSDHGFARPTKLLRPNVVLRKAGLLRPGPHRRAQSISAGGTAFVYLTHPTTAREDRAKIMELLRGLEGVAEILWPQQFAALHLPNPAKNLRMADLLLVAKEDYTFADEYLEDEVVTPIPMALGSHGYLSRDPRMNGVLVAWGRGVKPGTRLGWVDNIDVAPTLAAFLGESLPGCEGTVIAPIASGLEPAR